MTDTSQTCPPGWYEHTSNGLRLCGRPNTTLGGCTSVATFPAGGVEYSQVCGQARGYQYGDVGAFSGARHQDVSIDSYYANGLSLTHGANGSRLHIWTFVNGFSEDYPGSDACPCISNSNGTTAPLFVGSNYFCESGHANTDNFRIDLFYEDPLWDGSGCALEGNMCCEFNSPPYFSTQLLSATTDNIEGRICNGAPYMYGNTYVTFLELFIK